MHLGYPVRKASTQSDVEDSGANADAVPLEVPLLPIPERLMGAASGERLLFQLEAVMGSREFFPGLTTDTLGVNGVPGSSSMIRMRIYPHRRPTLLRRNCPGMGRLARILRSRIAASDCQ